MTKLDMESELAKDLLAALQENDKQKSKPTAIGLLREFGLPTLIVLVILWKGSAWVDVLVANSKAAQDASTSYIKAQAESSKKLVDSVNALIAEHEDVSDIHREQTSIAKENANHNKEIVKTLVGCQQQMSHVPAQSKERLAQSKEQLELLREIRDATLENGGT